ncbi:MAG TPA: pyruvate formate-lyase-activating protein [Rubrivivax sp.]|nr:pyruvate formate-lyase-activating protein [Rubrivivax sp.]
MIDEPLIGSRYQTHAELDDPLIGSRYQTHVEPLGDAERATVASYADVYAGDDEPPAGQDDELIGYLHSIEVGSTVDGPGLRMTIFLSGCTLRCQYCHNPDTWHKHNGRKITLGDMMREIGKYAHVLKVSKGGITISGGEPAVQHEFTTGIFKRAKALGLHTCMDTAGRLGERFTDAQLQDIDLHLLDVKSGDPETYRRVTEHPLQPTLDYARRLSELGRPVWGRFVLVPGLTDDVDNVEKVADVFAAIKSIERVEVLRFHQMGMDKWQKLGIPYSLATVEPPTNELAERVRQQFRSRGLTVF